MRYLGYSADEKSVLVDFKAVCCREESCGSETENKWVLGWKTNE